jgi:phosphohistidine phosphatase
MKTLLLIRHAKSSWDNNTLKDFDRPLNDRGKKNAPEMASRLLKRKIDIELFVSSPAKRAETTAILFNKEFKKDEGEIVFEPRLYNADPEDFYNVILKLDDKYKSIAVFSHNPGITDFANSLTEVRMENIPTCGIFGVGIEIEKWSEFIEGKKNFIFFDYPKSGVD